ncbi:MAG: GNAT family N-acetyltransferase [Sphingobacterium sp.]
MSIAFTTASTEIAEELALLRVEAMRPSLEAVGRFDRDRARRRFLDSFIPSDTVVVRQENSIIGFYVVRQRPTDLYLDHLYICSDCQGLGIGSKLIANIKQEASRKDLPISLVALKGSAANQFYLSRGFKLVKEEEFDNHYIWNS